MTTLQEDKPTTCELCLRSAKICDSHFVPNWVYKSEPLRGPGGKMIDLVKGKPTNKAMRGYWLCKVCEDKFSVRENYAKQFSKDSVGGKKYDSQLLYFATSISWRSLLYHRGRDVPEIASILAAGYTAEAAECWRNYLNSDHKDHAFRRHPQYLVMVGLGDITRGSILATIKEWSGYTFTFTRFSSYAIIGILNSRILDCLSPLERMRLHASGGRLPEANHIPRDLLAFFHSLDDCTNELARQFVKKQEARPVNPSSKPNDGT